jgi:hypothetical protein
MHKTCATAVSKDETIALVRIGTETDAGMVGSLCADLVAIGDQTAKIADAIRDGRVFPQEAREILHAIHRRRAIEDAMMPGLLAKAAK